MDMRISEWYRFLVPFSTHSVKERSAYADVDSLQAATTLDAAAAKCGVSLDVKGSGPEVRIDCPFGCAGDHCGRREVAINTENAQKVFQCHAYECGFRGNLLTLMHGWLTGSKPVGGKLKGDEFQRVKKVIAADVSATSHLPAAAATPPPIVPERNLALASNDDERIRELATIDEKFVREVFQMNQAAAAYVRRHPCLSSESMQKWRVGYLPQDGGGDKRGWSLRGNLIYPVVSELATFCRGSAATCITKRRNASSLAFPLPSVRGKSRQANTDSPKAFTGD